MQLEKQAIEMALIEQGWTICTSGSSHGMTITASKEQQQIVVYSCGYLSAWQTLATCINNFSTDILEFHPSHSE